MDTAGPVNICLIVLHPLLFRYKSRTGSGHLITIFTPDHIRNFIQSED